MSMPSDQDQPAELTGGESRPDSSDSESKEPNFSEPSAAGPPARERLGLVKLAWLIIFGVIVFEVFSPQPVPVDPEKHPATQAEHSLLELMGRYVVGAANSLPGANKAELYEQLVSQFPRETSPLVVNLRLATLAGELVGPDEALQRLQQLPEQVAEENPTADTRLLEARTTLERLYADYAAGEWAAPQVDDNRRETLVTALGWNGQLALAPAAGPDAALRSEVLAAAQRTLVKIGVAGFVLLGVGVTSLAGIALFGGLAAYGQLASRLGPGRTHGGIYAETFAFWLLYFATAGIIWSLVGPKMHQLVASGVVGGIGLLWIFWPVVRGLPWKLVRQEIGLHTGRGWWRELLWGPVCYICTLPLFVVGVILMLALTWLIQQVNAVRGVEDAMPMHPVSEYISGGSPLIVVGVFLLACLVAPVTEEIFFRGMLYRSLRDMGRPVRLGASILTSALLSSFVFAVIHPYGYMTFPALMALAIGFALMREWRGSLITPITAHALHNGTLITIALLFFS